MTKEQINEYSVRISQSSRTELVAITCEIIIDYINDAKAAVRDGNKNDFIFFVKKAMNFVDDLSSSLDMQYDISRNLLSLYMYVKRILIHGSAAVTDENFDSAVKVIKSIGSAFENAAGQDVKDEKAMESSQQIYAGYTYGKNLKLNEYVVRNV